MISIDNAWEVPLSRGGIYKIVVNDDNIEVYRIFSGRYIQEKLQLKKDMDYIDSLIVPGATDYIEPEQLYSDIKHMIEVIAERYFSIESEKIESIRTEKDPVDYRLIKFTDINEIKISAGERERFPELILNGDRYILPSKNFMAFQEEDKKKYEEYKIIVDDIRKKIGKA